MRLNYSVGRSDIYSWSLVGDWMISTRLSIRRPPVPVSGSREGPARIEIEPMKNGGLHKRFTVTYLGCYVERGSFPWWIWIDFHDFFFFCIVDEFPETRQRRDYFVCFVVTRVCYTYRIAKRFDYWSITCSFRTSGSNPRFFHQFPVRVIIINGISHRFKFFLLSWFNNPCTIENWIPFRAINYTFVAINFTQSGNL